MGLFDRLLDIKRCPRCGKQIAEVAGGGHIGVHCFYCGYTDTHPIMEEKNKK